jgi:hypothetical protein
LKTIKNRKVPGNNEVPRDMIQLQGQLGYNGFADTVNGLENTKWENGDKDLLFQFIKR